MQVISVNSLSRIFYHRQFSVRYLYCLPYNRYHSAIDFKSTSRRCYATSVAVPPPTIEVIPSGKLLNALGEPCLQALDLGCWYTPVGWVQCLLEMLHANLGLSWCASIALCSLILRTALFPIVIMNQKNAARVKYYSPKLSELQSTLMSARLRGDNFEALKAANELSIFMKKNRINPIRNIIPALIQMPVFLSTFLAIRGLTNFPLQSMTDGGMFWFPDLSQIDIFYALPIITTLTMLSTIEAGFKTGTAPIRPVFKNIMRTLPFLTLPITCRFTSGVVFYWTMNNLISLTQVLIIMTPVIRKRLDIPQLLEDNKPKQITEKSGAFLEMKKSWSNAKLLAEIEDRERLDNERFKKAGIGAVVPTFKEPPRQKIKC